MQRQGKIMYKYLDSIEGQLHRLHADKCGDVGFFSYDANCGSDIVTIAGEGIRKNVSARELIKELKAAKTREDAVDVIKNA